MTKITVDRALIEQAIEALKKSVLFCNHMGVGDWQPTAMACHSGIAALRAALAEPAVEPAGWQSIETAPKDSSSILIYTPDSRRKVREVWWAIPYEGATDGYWSTPVSPMGRGYTILPSAATHWMPLPPALDEPPPPAEPARTSQDVCTVPLLSDEEIHDIYDEVARSEPYSGAVTRRNVARAIEQLVRRKAGLKC